MPVHAPPRLVARGEIVVDDELVEHCERYVPQCLLERDPILAYARGDRHQPRWPRYVFGSSASSAVLRSTRLSDAWNCSICRDMNGRNSAASDAWRVSIHA